MIKKLFNKSPWDDNDDDDNIFMQNKKNRKKDNNIFNNLNDFNFNFSPIWILYFTIILLALWLASGFYKVQEGEEAVILRFGKLDRVARAGLNYKLPYPIETVIKEQVDKSRRVEIGYKSGGRSRSNMANYFVNNKSHKGKSSERDVKSESIMLTGDENIIELHVDVMWNINDLSKYLFNASDQIATVKSASESAIREVIGNTKIAAVLSNQKQSIALKIENLIQQTLDSYNLGVNIDQVKLLRAEPPSEVIQAYRDVQTAKADKEKMINEAEAYSNKILPDARGKAAVMQQQAEAHKESVIAKSKGEVARFDAIYLEYIKNKEITKSRLYIETVENILNKSEKTIVGAKNLLPHMPIK